VSVSAVLGVVSTIRRGLTIATDKVASSPFCPAPIARFLLWGRNFKVKVGGREIDAPLWDQTPGENWRGKDDGDPRHVIRKP
jgi:hypothetical protein